MSVHSAVSAATRREGPPHGGADFRLLGPVEVAVDGQVIALGGVKQRALLALLVLHANEVVSRDFLIDELWGERAPASAEHSIVVYVSRLRKALQVLGAGEMPVLATEAGGYVLRLRPEQIDVQRFERALERGSRALAEGAASDAAEILRSACAEWRGEPLSDLVAAPFVEGASWRLAELRLAALESRIDADLALGRHAELVGELESLVRTNPLNERLSAQLMVALYRSGRQARALEIYRATRRYLVDELGIEPAEDLQRLEQAILRHDPELEAPAPRSVGRMPPPSPGEVPAGPARQQRKTVSVLVARVAPPAHAAPADPEVLRLAMTRYFGTIRAAIERHGGRVERFGDDATLGTFGMPLVHEDDALRAVRAAAELRDAVGSVTTTLASEHGVTLEVRVGVDTGLVLAGPGASQVTGPPVGVAAELGQVAPAGEILLGAETVRVLARTVEVEPHRTVAVRGRAEPVEAFRFRGLPAAGQGIGRPSFDLDFVGRVAELEALRGAFEQAVAERGCRLVTVVGEPGIGKTRLLAEFTSRLAGEARVLVGRCPPYGDGITYWPLAGIVRELGGPGALADQVAADPQGEQLRELILGAVGAQDPTGSVDEVQWAIRRLFEALSREQPLVIALDDLHWAQPKFLQLVEYLAGCSSGAPILILAAAREELLETREAWALPRPNAQILPLRALSAREAQALVDQASGHAGMLESRPGRIAEAAAGNPLFIEQLLAHQAGRGGPPDELVPPTIDALLAERLDRLPSAVRDLLERAAVEGTVFYRGAVTALLRPDEQAQAGAHLLGAIRRNLVRPHPADLPGEDGFEFVHVLVRDAVYRSMPKELRAELHERFAGWLEERGPSLLEPDEVIGYHVEQAACYRRELGLPDDGLAERAGDRLAAAGRRALWRMDAAAAASLLGRALELTRPIRRDVHLEVDLAHAAGFLAPRRAVPIAEAAAEQARAAGDEPGEALARVVGAYFRAWAAADPPVDELEGLARAALPLLVRSGDHAGLVDVWWALALVANWRSRYAALIEAHDRALEQAGLAGRRGFYPLLFPAYGAALFLGPMPADEALAKVDRLMIDDPSDWLRMLRAGLLAMLDRFEEAWSIGLDASARLRERFGDRMEVELTLALMSQLADRHEAAEGYLRRVRDIVDLQREPGDDPVFDLDLARELCTLGRHDEAEPLARLAREVAPLSDLGVQMQWRQVQALVDSLRGEHAEAERLAREAVAISERTDSPNHQADALCDLAEVLRAAGKHAEAGDALVQALDRYERKRNLPMARRVRGLLGTDPASER